MMDERRFQELGDLLLDGELSAAEAGELRAHLQAEPAAVSTLLQATRDHVICRTALRPEDPALLRERTRRMLDAWRPSQRHAAVHAVLARVDRRRRWSQVRRWGGLAAAALLLALLTPILWDALRQPFAPIDAQAPELVEVHGEVRREGGLMATRGDRLAIGGELAVASEASVTLGWADGTRMVLSASGMITRLPGPGQRVRLAHGELRVLAAHRDAEHPLEVVCPDASVRVIGTAFAITVAEGRSRLAVSDGLVRLQRASDSVWSLVGAGQEVEAARLPLPRAIVFDVDHLAALSRAIAAGREPWASSHAALRAQVPAWLADTTPAPAILDVPANRPTNAGHHEARRVLYQLTQALLGLSLSARLDGDQRVQAVARERLQALTTIVLTGDHADIVGCDMLTVYGLQAADLLRGLPGWSGEDDALIARWILRELQPRAERSLRTDGTAWRHRGLVAALSIAAWRGDQATVIALMGEVRRDISTNFAPAPLAQLRTRMAMAEQDDESLFQALSHLLLAADIGRIAGGDVTPPPPAWNDAVTCFLDHLAGSQQTWTQQRFFLRALAGPGPWRSPAAARLVTGADPPQATYCWYFPTLVARDPRRE